MSVNTRTFEDIKAIIGNVHNEEWRKSMEAYDSWAKNYNQDLDVLEYSAPRMVAELIAKHIVCNREKMAVLDVACGTGLGAKEMKSLGFERFVGFDGSEGMLEKAKDCGLYQRLQCVLMGEEPIPSDLDSSFDVVIVIGALGRHHIEVSSIRDICKFSKQGGYICMTVRESIDNLQYKEAMELELKQMEDEELWRRVEVVKTNFRKEEHKEDGEYLTCSIFLYERM